jgi:SPP1 gp7 family putative phage head morphogenesis protein
MLTTYADTFTPRAGAFSRVSQAVTPVTAFTPRGADFDTSSARLVEDQVKRFKHWVYVAVDANSTKAAEQLPNVGILRRPGAPRKSQRQTLGWGAFSTAQRQHLKTSYPRVAQAMQYGGAELEPAPPNHPLAMLIQAVNPYGDWWQTFAYETYMFLQLTGKFVWWLIPSGLRSEFGSIPAEMMCVPPQWAKAKYSKAGDLEKWEIKPNGDERSKFDVPPDQIIDGHRKSPLSKIDPWSALTAGAEWVKNADIIEKARHLVYKHGNLQTVLLELDPEYYERVSDSLLEKTRDQFAQRFGGLDMAYRPIVQPPGVKVNPISLKPSEMLTDEASNHMRDNVLSLFRTPKGVVGLSEDYNRANIDGTNLIWCEHTICPLQGFVAGCMTEKLAKRYGPDMVVWYDDCRPMDAQQEREELKLDWMMGAVTPDERRQARGREPLNTPASQVTYVPSSVIPLDDAAMPEEPEEPDPVTDPDQSDENAEESQRSAGHRVIRQAKRETRILRSFMRLHAAQERNALSSLRAMWSRIKRDVLARLKAHGSENSAPSVSDLLPRAEFRLLFNKTMRPHWMRMCATGIEFEADVLGVQLESQRARVTQADGDEVLPDISVEYSAALKRAMREFLRERAEGVWEHVCDTTHDAMRRAIQQSLEAGEHIKEISERLEAVLDSSRSQAIRTARTEATASLNYGQQALREDEGIGQKQWLSTVDSKTRPTHEAAADQVVDNDKAFNVGGYDMMHPGDSSRGAPAEEIVSCRCCATGYVEL